LHWFRLILVWLSPLFRLTVGVIYFIVSVASVGLVDFIASIDFDGVVDFIGLDLLFGRG